MRKRERRVPRPLATMQAAWNELSGLGRIAIVGIALSAVVAIVLGFLIPRAVEAHLLHARTDTLSVVARELGSRGLVPLDDAPGAIDALDDAVRLRLLGGDTVRVKLWNPDGTIVYSDAPQLIGRTFPLDEEAQAALAGEPTSSRADVADDENVYERGFGDLLEFYVPITDDSGEVAGLFEVYQRATSLDASLGNIRRNVWLSISIGLGVLSVFMGSLTVAHARSIDRRRRQAEVLLSSSMRARDDERTRIVGALHDDIGQPLYRVLYGLRSARDQAPPRSELATELQTLEGLVRDVDRSLRTELRTLRHGSTDELDLESALEEMASVTAPESFQVDLDLDTSLPALGPRARAALFRAAQEGVTNAWKHSGTGQALIRLRGNGGRVLIEVTDSGAGWNGTEGLGLATTRERLEAAGGGLAILSGRTSGTTLTAWVPADSPS